MKSQVQNEVVESPEHNVPPDGFRMINGFPGYAINKNGVILSIHANGGQKLMWINAKNLKPTKSSYGYYVVDLCFNGKRIQKRVHVLVLTTFIGQCPSGLQCRHIDGNKANNRLNNLCWGTSFENHQDRFLHGTMRMGENHYTAKLNDTDVLEIRRRVANGEKQSDIARDFSVTKYVVSRIVLRKTWKHI